MINERQFDRALRYVHRTDLHTELEAKLREGQGGRKRALGTDVLLAAMLLRAQEDGMLSLVEVHKLLTTKLSQHLQRRHGIRTDTHLLTIRQVRYLFSAISALFEPGKGEQTDLTDLEREELRDNAREGLHDLMDRLTGAASVAIGHGGRYAVDATAIESAAKGRRENIKADLPDEDPEADPDYQFIEDKTMPDDHADSKRSWDPDARWGYRTRTYDNKTNRMFGFQMVAMTRVGEVGAPEVPLLMDRIRVLPGNDVRGLPEVLAVLDSLAENDQPVEEVISDRGYTYARHEDWAGQLAERGIPQVLDMHKKDRGARADEELGWVLVDGWPHVEGIPDHLVKIQRPARLTVPALKKKATRSEKRRHARRLEALTEFFALIKERRRYAFEKFGRTNAGTQRWRAPSHVGKLRCPDNPASMHGRADLPMCHHPLKAPKSCVAQTVAVTPTGIHLKLQQQDYWGSPEWVQSFSRRTRVEGGFGILKSARAGGLRRGWTHQVGLIKTSILLAIKVAAQNLTQLLGWSARTGDTTDPLTLLDVTDHGFSELDAQGSVFADRSPPGSEAA